MTRILTFVCVVFIAAPVHAQLVVIDPVAIAKTVEVVDITRQHYEKVVQTYNRWVEFLTNLPGIDRYNVPGLPVTRHDVDRYPYGAPMLRGFNAGDPRGDLYSTVIAALSSVRGVLATLPSGPARTALERQIAAIEISDSIVERGIHQVGANRGYSAIGIASAITNLTADVINGRRAYHYPTAILDKISGAEVIGRNQDMATNQLTSHLLEQLLNEAKVQRDADADTMNLRLGDIQHGQDAGAAMLVGSGAQIRAWRQP